MSGLQRIVRHPDRTNDPHARALALASDALLGPLDEADEAWLDRHLVGCDPCREATDAFAADALLLHELRDDRPPVPRDLGARVSLALDDEVRRATRRGGRRAVRSPGGRGTGDRGSMRRPGLALAGLAAVAVVALLVGPLAGPLVAPPGGAGGIVPTPSLLPGATPIAVDTQPVAWVSRSADGTYVISSADVGEVCPGVDASSCGTLDGSARRVAWLDMKPSSVILSQDGSPAVVVGQDAVYAVAVDFATPVTSPDPGASPVPTNEPVQSPAASGEPASPPADSPAPSGDPASPVPTETSSPDATPPASSEPTPDQTIEPASPTPTPPIESATPAPTPDPTPTLEITPVPATPPPPSTPAPTAATAFKIAERVVLVGASPAYSRDGRWVAFSARPADGSHGPDIYTWRVGQPRARALTTDHGSVFSGWLDGHILASTARAAVASGEQPSDAVPPADSDPATVTARSFLLDPADGGITVVPRAGVWRPVVDPTGRAVVYWTGSLGWSDAQHAWVPATGRLVAAEWKLLLDAGAEPASRPLPAAATGDSVVNWEVRFDPAGRRLGIWVADPADPGTGRLALVNVENDGTLGKAVLSDAAALPGFSLDADRLAWSTPPGRNGQGSLVTVYAWRGDSAGQLRSMPDPGDEPVVVAH